MTAENKELVRDGIDQTVGRLNAAAFRGDIQPDAVEI
jgi:hypothetical protein